MSSFPLMVHGEALDAVVAGGGRVAERKTRALLDAGARVRAIAPAFGAGMRALAADARTLTLVERRWTTGDVGAALLVVAATDDGPVNARVAEEARAARRLCNVADDPAAGNCDTPATHRAGELVIAVGAGGVPAAAARIRDAIAARFDGRYAEALRTLGTLRRRALDRGDRDVWRSASDALLDAAFCARVESGAFRAEVARWD